MGIGIVIKRIRISCLSLHPNLIKEARRREYGKTVYLRVPGVY